MRRRAPLPIDCIEAYAQRKLFCEKTYTTRASTTEKLYAEKNLSLVTGL